MKEKAPKLAMLLKRLLGAVKDVEKAIQGQSDTITETSKAANAKQSLPPLVHAEVNLPESVEIRKTATDAAEDQKYQSRTLLVSSLTLIALVIYAAISYGQLYEMRNATKATRDAANAAASAATTANDTLIASRKAFHIDQRAWLGMKTFNISPVPVPNIKLTANIEFQNFGKTPAFVDEIGTKLEVRDTPVPDNYKYKTNTSSYVLFPNQPTKMGQTQASISEGEFIAIKDEKKRLVLHGMVKYHDSFGNHWTTVCLQWGLSETWFQSCIEHNGADQEHYDPQENSGAKPY